MTVPADIWPWALPLAAAVIYAFASLCLKRGLEIGHAPLRSAFIHNWTFGLLCQPLWFFVGPPSNEVLVAAAVTCAIGFFAQMLTYAALRLGDVSVVTPIMGAKVLFVALFAAALSGETVKPIWWVGAMLSAGAVWLLSAPGKQAGPGKGWLATVFLTLGSAMLFGLGDVLIGVMTRGHNLLQFFAASSLGMLVLSLTTIPFFRGSPWSLPRQAWGWTIAASLGIGFQWSLLVVAFQVPGNVTPANILYNSRGLFSVLVMWSVGRWLGSNEHRSGSGVFAKRLLGSAIMLAAIILVLTAPKF